MEHNDFKIGLEFYCGGKKWRCTDVGTRVIVAIALGQREMVRMAVDPDDCIKYSKTRYLSNDPGDLIGPPYSVAESVFDEYDIEGCYVTPEDDPG